MLDLIWHRRAADIPHSVWLDCFGPPAEGLFWFSALETAGIADQFTFLFGALRQDGTTIGIVPAFIFDLPLELVLPAPLARLAAAAEHARLRKLTRLRTLFLGSVAGEEGHIGLRPGARLDEVAEFVHACAREQASKASASLVVWKDFPETDRQALDKLPETTDAFKMLSYPGSIIPLMPGGYGAYLRTMPGERRRKMEQKLRRGAAKLPITSTILKQPSASDISEIFALYWQTYRRGRTKFERLTPEFFAAVAKSDETIFVIQRHGRSDQMVSFMMLFDLGERIINQFIGIDYAATDGAYPYFRLFASAYDWACTTNARVMQSGQTGYMAKLESGHALVPLWNYCQHNNAVLNWIFRRVAERITWETLDEQLCEWLIAHPEALPPA